MAVGIHVAEVAFLAINKGTNQPVNKSDPNTKINDVLKTEHKHVIQPDASNSNTNNYPTIKEYLRLEAAANYIVHHISQNMIVTYNATDLNAA